MAELRLIKRNMSACANRAGPDQTAHAQSDPGLRYSRSNKMATSVYDGERRTP